MEDATALTALGDVPEDGSYLFTAEDPFTNETEVILVRCGEGVAAWVNDCPHENQRFDRGDGAPMRDGEIICPRHGSLFDACTGGCDNGEAAGTILRSVAVTVADGTVYLTDDGYTFRHEGPREDDEPGSTSHLSF
jgi:nitrite reductase/ring-hydroxylating ferredoxin subunit